MYWCRVFFFSGLLWFLFSSLDWLGLAWFGLDWFGVVRFGLLWFRTVWSGTVGILFFLVRYAFYVGLVWVGFELGLVGLDSFRFRFVLLV